MAAGLSAALDLPGNQPRQRQCEPASSCHNGHATAVQDCEPVRGSAGGHSLRPCTPASYCGNALLPAGGQYTPATALHSCNHTLEQVLSAADVPHGLLGTWPLTCCTTSPSPTSYFVASSTWRTHAVLASIHHLTPLSELFQPPLQGLHNRPMLHLGHHQACLSSAWPHLHHPRQQVGPALLGGSCGACL
jgi:hypothetical protein